MDTWAQPKHHTNVNRRKHPKIIQPDRGAFPILSYHIVFLLVLDK